MVGWQVVMETVTMCGPNLLDRACRMLLAPTWVAAIAP